MDRTIIEMQGPNCDELFERIRQEKTTQGKTVHQIIEDTGISKSTLDRFFAGTLKTPGFIPICALCAYYGISVDQIIGLAPPQEDQTAELEHLCLELAHKDELLVEKDRAINRLLDRSRIQEEGVAIRNAQIVQKDKIIAQKDADIKAVRKADRPLIFGLCGLCILLTIIWAAYVVLDASNPEQGLIRAGGKISAIIWLGAACVVVLLLLLLRITINSWYKQTRR